MLLKSFKQSKMKIQRREKLDNYVRHLKRWFAHKKVFFQEKDTEKNHKRCYILKRKVITVKNGKNKM